MPFEFKATSNGSSKNVYITICNCNNELTINVGHNLMLFKSLKQNVDRKNLLPSLNVLRNEFSFIASYPVSISSKLTETWTICSGGSVSWEALAYKLSSPVESKHKDIFQAVSMPDDQRIRLKFLQVQLAQVNLLSLILCALKALFHLHNQSTCILQFPNIIHSSFSFDDSSHSTLHIFLWL